MCTLCTATATFDPARHLDDFGLTDPALANLTETTDAAAGVDTTYSIQVGDTFSGELSVAGDRDWVAVTLQAGESYDIDVLAGGAGEGTLSDSYLRLYDGNGNLVTQNDDGGAGYDSALTFTAGSSGTYFISVGSYSDNYTGSYRVDFGLTPSGPTGSTGTLDEMADYLTDGYWNDQGFSGFQFDTSGSNQITVDITNLTAEGQQLARWAFEAWEMVADIDFVEVNNGADINFDDNQSGAFAGPDSVVGGFTTTATVNVDANWLATYGTTIDSYSFSTYIHEIGHALGLGHQGDYNGSAIYGIDDTFANDSYQLSVMSYFSQTANTTVNASYAEAATAMMVDIIAIQNLYGAPGSSGATAGNTTWGGSNSTLGTYLDAVFDGLAGGNGDGNLSGNPVAVTIYDQDGHDLLDLSYSTTNDRIDLRGASVSDIGGLIGTLAIARGTVVEDLTAGAGNDTITGNGANNRLVANDGNDTINGEDGNDTINGGNGNDVINGNAQGDLVYAGNGHDVVAGGFGRDTAFLGNGNDTYTDVGQGGWLGGDQVFGIGGNDTISTGGGNDTLNGGTGNDLLNGEDGNDVLDGGEGDDVLNGNAQGDLIYAGNGNDTVNGGFGRDTAFLGGGNDTYTDVGQGGWLGGDQVFGVGGNDNISTGGGNDTLNGGAGNDTLNGGTGNDLFNGGTGADVFIFEGNDTGEDTISDFTSGDDLLRLDDALWGGGLSRAEVLALADDSSGRVVFDFGDGNILTLDNLTSTNQLAIADLEII